MVYSTFWIRIVTRTPGKGSVGMMDSVADKSVISWADQQLARLCWLSSYGIYKWHILYIVHRLLCDSFFFSNFPNCLQSLTLIMRSSQHLLTIVVGLVTIGLAAPHPAQVS